MRTPTVIATLLLALTSTASADPPELITAPTGRLLPAAFLYGKSSLSTGGGVGSDVRVGLGDVAEFGIATTEAARDAPYVTAMFRMGVVEDRLFRHQPAVVLGFRKSFEHHAGDATTRFAELHLVASARLGARAAIHLGFAFWDASLEQPGQEPIVMHDHDAADQLRPIGGVELRAFDDVVVVADLSWAPSFCVGCQPSGVALRPVRGRLPSRIELQPIASLGVRYEVSDWVELQTGVRVTDLRDTQLFGQATFVSRRLAVAVARLTR